MLRGAPRYLGGLLGWASLHTCQRVSRESRFSVMTMPRLNISSPTGPAVPSGGESGLGDPTILRNIFRLMCIFCGYLLCVEILAVVLRLSPLTQGLLRFFPF